MGQRKLKTPTVYTAVTAQVDAHLMYMYFLLFKDVYVYSGEARICRGEGLNSKKCKVQSKRLPSHWRGQSFESIFIIENSLSTKSVVSGKIKGM